MDLALMCDIRYAARRARFAETYVRVGLVPGAGGAHFLPRLVGPARALELFFTGEFIDAEEAQRIGIVNKVFDDEALANEVRKVAHRIASASAAYAAAYQARDLSGDAQRPAHESRPDFLTLRRHHLDAGPSRRCPEIHSGTRKAGLN